MGRIFTVKCRNKMCRYRKKLYEGPGAYIGAMTYQLEKKIRSGERDAPEEIKNLLKKGFDLQSVAVYFCPKCKEWINKDDPYIYEPIHISPYGTVREYKMHYVFGTPVCDECGTELVHLFNPRSSKNRCPKCGMDNLIVKQTGFYD